LKSCGARVTFKIGAEYTFAENAQGHVLGWPRCSKNHDDFRYYPLKSDRNIFLIDKALLLSALRSVRAALDRSRDRVRVCFDRKAMQTRFAITEGTIQAESEPVPVTP